MYRHKQIIPVQAAEETSLLKHFTDTSCQNEKLLRFFLNKSEKICNKQQEAHGFYMVTRE